MLPAGTYTVGAGGTYATLTLAVADYNSKTITGPVTFSLIENATAPEAAETYPITINANPGASSTNTLTIRPSAAGRTMTGTAAATALIILNGADWVTIDGSNAVGGTSRDLTITNTNIGTTR